MIQKKVTATMRNDASGKGKISPPWTQEEDAILHTPDTNIVEMAKLLPHRSKDAVASRMNKLGISRKRMISFMSAAKASKIRQLTETCTRYEEIAQQVGTSRHAIASFCQSHRLLLAKTPIAVTGNATYDEIRRKVLERGMTLRNFDKSLSYKTNFFASPRFHTTISIGMYEKAVKALGGRFVITWDDDDRRT